MAVRKCKRGDIAVAVAVSKGERLRYSVSFSGAKAVFTLVNKQGTVLLSQSSDPGAPGPWELVWPGDSVPNTLPAEFSHTLGVHFLAAAEYTYKVTKEDATGVILSTVKECAFTSDEAEDWFFEPLSVFAN